MYRDAKEELKRLEEALLEEDEDLDDISQWDFEEALSDIPDLPKKTKGNRGNRGLIATVIALSAGILAVLIFWFIRYGGVFL